MKTPALLALIGSAVLALALVVQLPNQKQSPEESADSGDPVAGAETRDEFDKGSHGVVKPDQSPPGELDLPTVAVKNPVTPLPSSPARPKHSLRSDVSNSGQQSYPAIPSQRASEGARGHAPTLADRPNSAGGLAIAASDVSNTTAELEIELPADAEVPAVLAGDPPTGEDSTPEGPKSPAQQASADAIAEDFLNRVLPPDSAQSTSVADWNDAAELADQRYRSLYGHEEYLRRSVQAAKDALSGQ